MCSARLDFFLRVESVIRLPLSWCFSIYGTAENYHCTASSSLVVSLSAVALVVFSSPECVVPEPSTLNISLQNEGTALIGRQPNDALHLFLPDHSPALCSGAFLSGRAVLKHLFHFENTPIRCITSFDPDMFNEERPFDGRRFFVVKVWFRATLEPKYERQKSLPSDVVMPCTTALPAIMTILLDDARLENQISTGD
jgi:hypothetical protein